jgi:hypothetical protein
MSEQVVETKAVQGNKKFETLKKNLKDPAFFEKWLGKLDLMLIPFYAILLERLMGLIGERFVAYGATTIDELVYYDNLISGLVWISLIILALSFWDSLRRNEVKDTFWVVLAIVVNYLAITLVGSWSAVTFAYSIGYVVTYIASRHGKMDWTPIVAYNAAYIGMASFTFGVGAASIALPVMVSVIFEVAEIIRNRDYRAVRLAYPGLVVALVGLIVTVNPVLWILTGAFISFIVTPTAVKVYHNTKKKGGSWLKSSGEPFKDCDNGLKDLRINIEATMLTLVVSSFACILMIIVF